MASTLSNEDVEMLRRDAKSAEPFAYDDKIFEEMDGPPRSEQEARRVSATLAKLALEKAGIPLDED